MKSFVSVALRLPPPPTGVVISEVYGGGEAVVKLNAASLSIPSGGSFVSLSDTLSLSTVNVQLSPGSKSEFGFTV
jgi:hypothetical protein